MKKFVFLILAAVAFYKATAAVSIPYSIEIVLEYLEKEYVNPKNFDMRKILMDLKSKIETQCQKNCNEETLEPLVAEEIKRLGDKHLNYFQTYETKGFDDTLPDNNQPIGRLFGILVREFNNKVVVVGVNPTENQVFSVGDVIISINDTKINNLNIFQEFERKRITSNIKFQSNKKTISVSIYPSEQIWQNQGKIVNKILHIRLNSAETDFDDLFVHSQIQKALNDKINGVILDLRNCFNGGRTFGAINIAAAFLNQIGLRRRGIDGKIIDYSYENGQLFYYEEAKDFRDSRSFPNPVFWRGKVVVLTSKYTFSACENIASYLKEKNRAKIIGENTIGGGGVTVRTQTTSTQYSLTFSRQRHYYLPSDKPQDLQVIPDQNMIFDVKEALETGRDLQLEEALDFLSK
jgi:C-terminal processing protease CtpA/Prc